MTKKKPFCLSLYIQKHYTQFGHNSSCFGIYNIVVQLQRRIINVKQSKGGWSSCEISSPQPLLL